jgi:hypothetical protein
MLILPIKKKWFDMIVSGQKKEEYREIKDYYDTRIGHALLGYPLRWCSKSLVEEKMKNETIEVLFKNGYGYDVPTMYAKCKVRIDYGKKEWGAEEGKKYFVLEIVMWQLW